MAGLSFASRRDDVRAALGAPVRSSGPQDVAPRVENSGWDVYEIEGFCVHFTYAARDGRLELLTVSRTPSEQG